MSPGRPVAHAPRRGIVKTKRSAPSLGAAANVAKPAPLRATAATVVAPRQPSSRRRPLAAVPSGAPAFASNRAVEMGGLSIVVVHLTDAETIRVFLKAYLGNKGNKSIHKHIRVGLLASTELIFWVPAANVGLLSDVRNAARTAGVNAGGVLGFTSRARNIEIRAIQAPNIQPRFKGKASAMVDMLKAIAEARGATLGVSSPPCLSAVTVTFWMRQRFNPSSAVHAQKALYDGSKQHVSGSENVGLFWVNDSQYNSDKMAAKVIKKFQLDEKFQLEVPMP